MKTTFAILFLAGATFAQAAPEKAAAKAPTLADAGKQWKSARADFKRLNRFEKIAIRDARATYFGSACGKLLQPTLKSTAGLLAKAADIEARKKNEKFAKLAKDIAAAANLLAGKAEAATGLGQKWEAAAKAKADPKADGAFGVLAKGDPRQRAFKANVAAINAALATLKKMKASEATGKYLDSAVTLTAKVGKCLDSVPAARLAPAKPAPTQTPT